MHLCAHSGPVPIVSEAWAAGIACEADKACTWACAAAFATLGALGAGVHEKHDGRATRRAPQCSVKRVKEGGKVCREQGSGTVACTGGRAAAHAAAARCADWGRADGSTTAGAQAWTEVRCKAGVRGSRASRGRAPGRARRRGRGRQAGRAGAEGVCADAGQRPAAGHAVRQVRHWTGRARAPRAACAGTRTCVQLGTLCLVTVAGCGDGCKASAQTGWPSARAARRASGCLCPLRLGRACSLLQNFHNAERVSAL